MACDYEQVCREVETAIAAQCERSGKRVPESLQGDADDEIARFRAMALHHADMLGSALAEIALWLAKDEARVPISQRKPRGRERMARTGLNRTQ